MTSGDGGIFPPGIPVAVVVDGRKVEPALARPMVNPAGIGLVLHRQLPILPVPGADAVPLLRPMQCRCRVKPVAAVACHGGGIELAQGGGERADRLTDTPTPGADSGGTTQARRASRYATPPRRLPGNCRYGIIAPEYGPGAATPQ